MVEEILKGIELFFKLFSVFLCSIYLWNSIIYLKNGSKSIHYYFYLIYYFFFIMPIILLIFVPNYQYKIFWRANEAMADPLSNIIYCIFSMIFSSVIIYSSYHSPVVEPKLLTYNRFVINICTFIIIFIFIFTIAINGLEILTAGYGAHYTTGLFFVSEPLIGCGIICYLVLIGYLKYISKTKIVLLSLIILTFFSFVGKRYIIAETLVLCVYVLSITGQLNNRKFIHYLFFAVIGILSLGIIYGIVIKKNFTGIIDYLSVDFSRQYTLVYQFYCKKIGRPISIYQLDAIIYLLTCLVPRKIWPQKPYSFVNQLTFSLVSDSSPEFRNMGWATTCSIFSDLFDSLSYLGLIVGIILFILLLNKANLIRKPHFKIWVTYLCIKLITVQLSSSIIQIIVSLILFIFCDILGKTRSR